MSFLDIFRQTANAGSYLPLRQALNFTGSLSAADNAALGTTDITVAGVPTGLTTLEAYNPTAGSGGDDTAAYVAAVASGKTIMLGAKTYNITGSSGWAVASITTPGQGIIGVGDQSVLHVTNNYAAVDASAGAGLTVLSNFRVTGTGTGASQHGVTVGHDAPGTGQSRVAIENVVCENLGGRGFSLEYTSISFLGPRLVNCFAYGCTYGYYVALSDFPTFANCSAYGCSTGVYMATGNVMWVGGSISGNTSGSGYGIYWDVSGNDAHSQFVGTEIDHNLIAVYTKAITNGLSFVGCNIYYGTIDVSLAASLVTFAKCFIDVTSIAGSASAPAVCDGCYWPMANANTPTNISFTPGNRLVSSSLGFALGAATLENGANPQNFSFGGVVRASIQNAHGHGKFGGGGSDNFAYVGPLVGSETAYAALYLLANGNTPSGSNPAAYSDGSSLVVTTPLAGGTLYFYNASSTLLGSATPSLWKTAVPHDGGYLRYSWPSNAGQTLNAAQSANNYIRLFAGTISGPQTLTISRAAATCGQVHIRNVTGFQITVQWLTGTGVAVANNTSAIIGSDGTNAEAIMVGT